MSAAIRTNVGCAGYGDNYVRGRSVRDELLGKDTRWSLLSRLIDGPELSRDDAQFLDDVLVAAACPDPRIWPLKIAWLLGSYGDWWAAAAGVQSMLAEARMGPWAGAAPYAVIEEFARLRACSHESFEGAVLAYVEERWSRGAVVWGFGVAGGGGRRRDERLDRIAEAAALHGRADAVHYSAAMEAGEIVFRATDRAPNMALAFAAIGRDLGLTRAEIEVVMFQILEPQILGNAYESARLSASTLQRLPDSKLRYVGQAPRLSPRAAATSGPADRGGAR
ncbi:MAG TPA: hypothetical protein ENK57_14680 [Polyangiaceae bacterium]|nr:hypothetical protein [Polyangiaceae bacterium]